MRITKTLTIDAGSPVNLVTGGKTAVAADERIYATAVFVQMLHGGTSLGYVFAGIAYGNVPSALTDNPLELDPASADAPGGSMELADYRPGGGIEVSQMWVDGLHDGDTVAVWYEPL